jgi:hypothetical protein
MKKLTYYILTFAFSLYLTGSAYSSLIEDEVFVTYKDPFFSQTETVTVKEGSEDAIDLLFGVMTVDMEADGVIIDFNRPNTFGSASFAGLIIDDLDYDNNDQDYILLGVEVDTNMRGWADNRILFDDDTVSFNWYGLFVDENTYFTVIFEFGPNPIPIPNSVLLFVTGIAGFALIRRRISN